MNNVIANIENQLFTVLEQQMVAQNPTLPILQGTDIIGTAKFEQPTLRGLYRTTGGSPLGVIGKNFNVVQPQVLFDNLIKCVGEIRDIDIDGLSYRELKGGSKIQFKVQLDPISFKNRNKKVDDIETFATLTTGYDGLTKTSFNFETYRLWCANGCSHLDKAVSVAVKNTVNNETIITNLCDDLSKLIGLSQDKADFFKYLDSVDLTELKKQRIIKAAVGFNADDKAELSIARLATLEEIEACMEKEINFAGGTLWGAFNGITRYTNHGGRSKDDDQRLDYLFAGGGTTINTKAEKELRAMIA